MFSQTLCETLDFVDVKRATCKHFRFDDVKIGSHHFAESDIFIVVLQFFINVGDTLRHSDLEWLNPRSENIMSLLFTVSLPDKDDHILTNFICRSFALHFPFLQILLNSFPPLPLNSPSPPACPPPPPFPPLSPSHPLLHISPPDISTARSITGPCGYTEAKWETLIF